MARATIGRVVHPDSLILAVREAHRTMPIKAVRAMFPQLAQSHVYNICIGKTRPHLQPGNIGSADGCTNVVRDA